MNPKPFLTYDESIALLDSRGVDFSHPESKSYAKKKLQRIGYYNLINGYGPLFRKNDGTDNYLEGTTIEEIHQLYIFDTKLREISLKNILPFESNIKSLVAYHFSQAHPETNYLIYTNFDTERKGARENITSLIADTQRQISNRASDPSIAHYLQNYGYIPLWVLNNILTLGTISKFYSLMKQKERQDIARIFHISDNELESILTYLSSIRNFCAHGNRLYCYRSKRPLCNTDIHAEMCLLSKDKQEYVCGKRDFFAFIISSKKILSKIEFRRLIMDIDIAIKNLLSHCKVLTEAAILDSMGLPPDWKKLLLQLK